MGAQCAPGIARGQASTIGDDSKHPMGKQHDGTWELRLLEEEVYRDAPEDGYPVYKYAIEGAGRQSCA